MSIADHLKTIIRENEKQLQERSSQAAQATEKSVQAQSEAERLSGMMNFRERYLRGWFGGDKDKVSGYKQQLSLTAQFNEQARQFNTQAEELDRNIRQIIDKSLRGSDAEYQALVKPYDAAEEVKGAIDSFLGRIDFALSRINDAQTMETIDLFSKNKGVSVLSYVRNSEASGAIDAVRAAAPAFQEAVDQYNHLLKDCRAPRIDAQIGDGVDLVFDLAFDGFDFMSIFTLSALGHAEDNMAGARQKVEEVNSIVNQNLDKAKNAVHAYVQQVRTACL